MQPITGEASVNGARLYYERVGAGPSALFIAGSTGDAGNFTRAAERLADEFTVVTYDRRGNSRSPRPAGWAAASVGEQADDAAGLIERLDLAPAALFAASAGALIGLDLAIRYPRLLRIAVLQEPSLFTVLADLDAALAPRRAIIREAAAAGGSEAVVRALVRHLNGDAVFDVIPADVLKRMLANGDTILNIESAFAAWRPREDDLRSIAVPVVLMIAEGTLPIYRDVMAWLEPRLQTRALSVPGPHGFYYFRPDVLADTVRPLFRPRPR